MSEWVFFGLFSVFIFAEWYGAVRRRYAIIAFAFAGALATVATQQMMRHEGIWGAYFLYAVAVIHIVSGIAQQRGQRT